jgi:hypothetical protein
MVKKPQGQGQRKPKGCALAKVVQGRDPDPCPLPPFQASFISLLILSLRPLKDKFSHIPGRQSSCPPPPRA